MKADYSRHPRRRRYVGSCLTWLGVCIAGYAALCLAAAALIWLARLIT